MTFAQAFKISNFLVFLSAFVSILLGGGVSLPTAACFLGLLAIGWFVPPIRMRRGRQFLLVFVLFALFGLDAFLLSSLGAATVRLLLWMGLYKLFVREQGADYLIVYLISFSLLLVASTYTLSISFLATLVAYVFLGVLTLVLFESRAAFEENDAIPFSAKAFLQVATAITGLTILLAIPIFLAIPRGAAGLLGSDSSGNVAGFSDSVSLGDSGAIRTNSEVIMRVALDWPLEMIPWDLKWKGVALDYFDGRDWSRHQADLRRVEADATGRFMVAGPRRQQEAVLTQSFSVEPFTNVLFGAAESIQIAGISRAVAWVLEDKNGSCFLPRAFREPFRYYVYSDIRPREQRILAPVSGEIPPEIAATYLQLPDLDPRIHQLALSLTEAVESPVAKALQLELFLKEGFEYTLENPSGGRADPLADFLMRTRAGHCEYFAAAHAVMLRSIGIPSRVINGFQRGEYNPWGEYFFVRQSDAHSWVEGYFPGIGWIDFDPTPSSRRGEQWAALRVLAQFVDSMDALWSELVTFDRSKQATFFRSLWAKLKAQWSTASHRADGLVRFNPPELDALQAWVRLRAGAILSAAGLGLLAFLVFRYRRYLRIFWKRRVLRQSGGAIAEEYYLELLDLLERKGLEKSPSETPLEFGRRAWEELQSSKPIEIVEVYYRNRFGAYQIGEAELAMVYAALRELRRSGTRREDAYQRV